MRLMMKNVYMILIAALVMGCGGNEEPKEEPTTEVNKVYTKEDRLKDIQQLEEKLFGNKEHYDEGAAHAVVKQYIIFVDNFPEDERSPQYLFRAGEVSIGLKRSIEAIKFFQRLEDEYPHDKKVPESVFLQAFVFDAHLHDVDRAKEAYEKFLEKYPDHALAKDAEMSLKILGKSDEELIKEFEAKQKASS